MKFSKNIYLVISAVFAIGFFNTFFVKRNTYELFFCDVDVWIYLGYQFLMAVVFIKYFDKKRADLKNN